jgi:peptidoglycan hydrolase FlgJ
MDLPPFGPTLPAQAERAEITMAKAQELEAAFLSEMLAHSGLGDMQGPFGGGSGEAQFSSFLRQEQARLMVENGGIGLAELIFRSMTEVSHGDRT